VRAHSRLKTTETKTSTAISHAADREGLLANAVVTTTIRLRFNGRCTEVRLLIRGHKVTIDPL